MYKRCNKKNSPDETDKLQIIKFLSIVSEIS